MVDTAVFECKLCMKPFDERVHRPLSLPCGHVFCGDCLQKSALQDSTLCPVHRTQYHISLNHLPTCFAILVNLPKNKSLALKCSLHPRHKLKFRCLTHRQNLCTDCIIAHSDSAHRVTSLETFTTQMRTEAKAVSEQMQRRIVDLEEGRKWVQKCETKLAGLYETQTHLVKQTYEEAVQNLQTKKTQLLRELSGLWTRQTRELEKEKSSLTTTLQRLSDTIRHIREMQERLPGGIEELDSILLASHCDCREIWQAPDLSSYVFQGGLHITDQSTLTRRGLDQCTSLRTIGANSTQALKNPGEAFALSQGPQVTPRSISKANKEHHHPLEKIEGCHKVKSHRKRSAERAVALANSSF